MIHMLCIIQCWLENEQILYVFDFHLLLLINSYARAWCIDDRRARRKRKRQCRINIRVVQFFKCEIPSRLLRFSFSEKVRGFDTIFGILNNNWTTCKTRAKMWPDAIRSSSSILLGFFAAFLGVQNTRAVMRWISTFVHIKLNFDISFGPKMFVFEK